jgi:hypothetical protein
MLLQILCPVFLFPQFSSFFHWEYLEKKLQNFYATGVDFSNFFLIFYPNFDIKNIEKKNPSLYHFGNLSIS